MALPWPNIPPTSLPPTWWTHIWTMPPSSGSIYRMLFYVVPDFMCHITNSVLHFIFVLFGATQQCQKSSQCWLVCQISRSSRSFKIPSSWTRRLTTSQATSGYMQMAIVPTPSLLLRLAHFLPCRVDHKAFHLIYYHNNMLQLFYGLPEARAGGPLSIMVI